MSNTKYEVRVREVAEKMAAAYFPNYRFMTGRQKTHADNKMMNVAKLAVNLQSDLFSQGYGEGAKFGFTGNIRKHLIERGLITEYGCKHEHLQDVEHVKGQRYGPRCKDCGEFVMC